MRSVARIFVVALMAFAAVASAEERMLVEGILVRVNDRIITVSDFAQRVRTELSQFPEPPSEAEARKFVEIGKEFGRNIYTPEGPLVVYGTVIAWANEPHFDDGTPARMWEVHLAEIERQSAEWRRMISADVFSTVFTLTA